MDARIKIEQLNDRLNKLVSSEKENTGAQRRIRAKSGIWRKPCQRISENRKPNREFRIGERSPLIRLRSRTDENYYRNNSGIF